MTLSISCVSTDPGSSNNLDLGDPLDPADLATINLTAAESVVCTIVNDDIAPTVTVHKVVIGGVAQAGEFQMTVDGNPVDQDIPVPTMSNTPIVVSEEAVPGYDQTGVVCTDNDANDLLWCTRWYSTRRIRHPCRANTFRARHHRHQGRHERLRRWSRQTDFQRH
jgi:hypothetical protein